ncbi:hypothetical protein H5410_026891 [Solanum commersonii]|uniref:Uncharacterized protein n=1 Tax=Solanum commersonii TaxID=4109 RepID=A0A9J5Z0D5_SOLCO|nr:hypothetical protein H5410_026891 [Solanum commersonii]
MEIGVGSKRNQKGSSVETSSRAPTELPLSKIRKTKFPQIHAMVYILGIQYIFLDQGECNLSFVCEFYVNWNTNHLFRNRGDIRYQLIWFTLRALNHFLGTPN